MTLRDDNPKLLLGIVGDMLVQASDRAGEALAHAAEDGKMDPQSLENLMGINLAIWSARWEIGLSSGAVTAEGAAGGSEVMDVLAARKDGEDTQ